MTFEALQIISPILKQLQNRGYRKPTPLQKIAIPEILKGKDIMGLASSGTGKTEVFSLPILQGLDANGHNKGDIKIKVCILTTTKNLAAKLEKSFFVYGNSLNIKSIALYGGIKKDIHLNKIKKGVHVVIATPNRLVDFLENDVLSFDDLAYFGFDDAEHMYELGYEEGIKKICSYLPQKRQTILFTSKETPRVEALAKSLLSSPVPVKGKVQEIPPQKVKQQVFYTNRKTKYELLLHIIKESSKQRIIFSYSANITEKLSEFLNNKGQEAAFINENTLPEELNETLSGFKAKKFNTLLVSDKVAKKVPDQYLNDIIHFDIPKVIDTYFTRLGKAKDRGLAQIICGNDESNHVSKLKKKGIKISVVKEHPFPAKDTGKKGKSKDRSRNKKRKPYDRFSKDLPESLKKKMMWPLLE